jgi:hypothetical protein
VTEGPETAMPRTRRALLTAAAGAAAAAAATAIAPAAVLAHDVDDVQKSTDNATTAITSITQGTADTNAFEANGMGIGVGVVGTTDATVNAGVVGTAGDTSGSLYVTHDFDIDAGVYGYASQTFVSSGVVAEGPTGMYATGDWGIYADGQTVGIFTNAYPSGTALQAHAGSGEPPAPLANVALLGTVSTTSQTGLRAHGKVQFPNRSGRVGFAAGAASKTVSVSGVTSTNMAFAVVNKNASGLYVRAVVPATGKITIYLSKGAPSGTYVSWLVLG